MDAVRQQPVEPRLGLWDAVSLIVGIIIGVGIFATPSDIFAKAPGPLAALGVWALGGLLAFVGALCFAELASTYPHSGGEYIYLTRSFGSLAGYLLAWAQMAVIRPGSIGAVAYVFAEYAGQLLAIPRGNEPYLAIAAVLVLTWINMLGVVLGKRTQNVLTLLKVMGLAGIIAVGLGWGQPRWQETTQVFASEPNWFAASMFLVLWSYAGWHEAGYVAAEVKNSPRNLPLALLLGTGLVTAIYLLINFAYWLAGGFEPARVANLPARILELAWGSFAGTAMAILIVISSLGALNGMIFTSARINVAFGADHRLFSWLSRWHYSWQTPVIALAVGAGITVIMIAAVGVFGSGKSGLEAMIEVTNGVFWFSFVATGLALFALRKKEPDIPRPFRVPLYPLLPALFCLWCGYMVFMSFSSWYSLIGIAILVAGLPFHCPTRRIPKKQVTDIEVRTPAVV